MPSADFNPVISPFSITSSVTVSCQINRFSVLVTVFIHSWMNCCRSLCERGLHIAGPFERFSIRNCMALRSVTIPIWPPNASISRTICPLAIPPTAGLQLICPILFMSMVISRVFDPMLAAAVAASQPACPAPITIMSYLKSIVFIYYLFSYYLLFEYRDCFMQTVCPD